MLGEVRAVLDDGPDLSKANAIVSDIIRLASVFFSPSERSTILSEIRKELQARKIELDCLQI